MNQKLNINKLKLSFFKSITSILIVLISAVIYVSIYKKESILTLTILIVIFIFMAYFTVLFIGNKYTKKINNLYNESIEKIQFNEGYLKAVENNSSNIIITSLNKELFSANQAFFNFSGFNTVEKFREKHECICDLFIIREGYLQKTIDGLIWMEYISKYPDTIHKAILLKNGIEHIFQVSSSDLNIDDEYRKIATFVDISELENLKDRYQFAINGTQDGLWDWNLKTGDLYFSPQWKKQLGYEDNELKNELETWKSKVHPEDIENAINDIEANNKGKTTFYENIHRLKHKDGSWVWILDRGQTIFDNKKNAIRMIGFHADITKLQESKIELLKLKAVIEQSPISVLITDIKGQIEYANPGFCKVSGYNANEVIGKNPRILKSGYTTKDEYKKLWKTIKNNQIWEGTFKDKKKDGELYWETITIVPINNENGNIINYVGIKQEITKEIHLKQEIKEQEEIMIAQSRHAAMGEMISMIAHQWRQPLSVISMASNNILADIELECVEEESLKEISLEIIDQTQELSKTIDDFRNFFKPNKNTEEIYVKDIFDEAFQIMGKSLENNGIKITKEFQNNKRINTYSRELMQVLINIIKNAKEALEDKRIKNKQIMIKTEETPNNITISIQDNAGGINEDIIYKIFEPYFSTKNEKSGTGLGLYMSKTIIEKHLQGTINVYNKNDGACFCITLPFNLITNIETKV